MWSGLARAIDHVILGAIGFALRPRYLHAATLPDETFIERLARWQDARCELLPAGPPRPIPDGRRQRFTVRIEANGRTLETTLFFDRVESSDGGATNLGSVGATPSLRSRNLIVYHHGLGEPPLGGSYAALVAERRDPLPADRVALVGLGHDLRGRGFDDMLSRLDGFEDMLACGVIAAKHAAEQWGPFYERVILSGMSIGGIVALVETLERPRFDANVSLLATPFLAAMLLRSSLGWLIDSRFRRRVAYGELRAMIDIDACLGRRRDGADGDNPPRIVMINGRHDTMVDIGLLRDWWPSRPGIERHELGVSHLSGVLSPGELIEKTGQVLRTELAGNAGWNGPRQASRLTGVVFG